MFGFVSGASISLLGAPPASVSPMPVFGYRMGVIFFAISIRALTKAPVGGAIVQHGLNGWLDVEIFGVATAMAGTAIIFGSRLLYTDKEVMKVL
jgi:hypothetical protein